MNRKKLMVNYSEEDMHKKYLNESDSKKKIGHYHQKIDIIFLIIINFTLLIAEIHTYVSLRCLYVHIMSPIINALFYTMNHSENERNEFAMFFFFACMAHHYLMMVCISNIIIDQINFDIFRYLGESREIKIKMEKI